MAIFRIFAIILFLTSLCHAQKDLLEGIPGPPPIFTERSLAEALKESIAAKKFLVVYPHYDKPGWREMDKTTWKNPTLATWVMWHAIAVRVDPKEDGASYSLLMRAGARGVRGIDTFPHVLVFCDGKFVWSYPDNDFQGYLMEPNPIFGDVPDPSVWYPKAMQVLFMLDLVYDRQRAKDPVWMEMHDVKNPVPPPPPELTPLCHTEDGAAPVTLDPPVGSDGKVDVFSMIGRARTLAKNNELYDATGAYSWLWERAEKFEPSIRAARLSFLVDEIADLCNRRDGTKKRFEAIRQRMADRQPWWTWDDLLEWIILSRALNHEDEVLGYLTQYTVDDQEAGMMPSTHRSVYNALSNIDAVRLPRDTSKACFDRIAARQLKLQTARPMVGTPPAEWQPVVDLRRRLLIDEGSRLYAALLLQGDAVRAGDISRIVLAAREDASSRLSLVTTARIAGCPERPEHQRWLAEAAAGAGGAIPTTPSIQDGVLQGR